MNKPYIICHMMASLDGRIDCAMTEQIENGDEYYDALSQLSCPTMLMGRTTMQMHYADGVFVAKDSTPYGQTGFSVALQTKGYLVAMDTKGTLKWSQNKFDGQHLVVVTSEKCPKEYLDDLDKKHISWIAVGENSIDLAKAMDILYTEFVVERMVVTGGGHINASFLAAGLLDEVSMMYAPGIDGRGGMAAAFDGLPMETKPTKLQLTSVDKVGEGTVWMRYKVGK